MTSAPQRGASAPGRRPAASRRSPSAQEGRCPRRTRTSRDAAGTAGRTPRRRVGQQLGGVESVAGPGSKGPRRASRSARRRRAGAAAKDAVGVADQAARSISRSPSYRQSIAPPRGQSDRDLEPLRRVRRRARLGSRMAFFMRPSRERAIERGVALRRPAPGDVGAHAVQPDPPHRRASRKRQRALERVRAGLRQRAARTGRRWRRRPPSPPRWRRSPCRRGRRRGTRPASRRNAGRTAGSVRRARSATARG